MLESMRNQAQSWIAKLILGGVALSFVLWGVGDYFNSAGVQTVAEVDGAPINDAEFNLAYERKLNSYRSLLGKQFSKEAVASLGLKEETIQTLINRRLVLAEARESGLVAPQDVLLATVRSNPSFQSAGSFDAQRYQVLTRNLGYRTPTDYEASLRLDLIATAMQRALMDSATVNDADVREAFAREFEKREIAALIVEPSVMEKKVKIDDTQARAWYESHMETYYSPLRLTLNVVVIDPKKIAADMSVTEADIKAAYEEHQDRYLTPETRQARHILVSLPKDADDAARKAAQTRIEASLKKINSGKSFASVARTMSDDKATAKNGGDIGYMKQGDTVSAFDSALFSMNKGDVSEVIETQFGLHLIKLEDIKPEHVKPLEEVHDALKKELALARADEEAYTLSQDLDDALGREDTLKAAADSIDLRTVRYGPISIEEARAYPVLGNAAYRTQLFNRQPGDAIEVNELGKGQFVAIEVLKRDEPAEQPFEKVSTEVYADAKQAAAVDRARELAGEILAAASGTRLGKLAQQHGLPIYLTKPVRLNGEGDSDADWLSPDVLQTAFGIEQGQVADHVLTVNKGFAVVQVNKVIAADEADFAEKKAAIRADLLRSEGAVRYARWMANTRAGHEIKINRAVLEKF